MGSVWRFIAELRDQGGALLRTMPVRDTQVAAEAHALRECQLLTGVYVIQVWRERGGTRTLVSETWP